MLWLEIGIVEIDCFLLEVPCILIEVWELEEMKLGMYIFMQV